VFPVAVSLRSIESNEVPHLTALAEKLLRRSKLFFKEIVYLSEASNISNELENVSRAAHINSGSLIAVLQKS
jgi:hypothetical protein